MAIRVRVLERDRHVVEPPPVFARTGHHRISIVYGARRVVGIITESGFVQVLSRGNYASADLAGGASRS
jgi:CBS domain-containing membrane protein